MAGMEPNPYQAPASGKRTEASQPAGDRMNAQELFGVVVRGIGLYFILSGISSLLYAAFLVGGSGRIVEGINVWPAARGAVEWLVPGVIAFFFPKFVVGLTYRRESGDAQSESEV